MNHDNAQDAIVDGINQGAPVPPCDAAMLERVWTVLSDIAPEQREHGAIGLGAIAGPDPVSVDPAQQVGLMMRSLLFQSLERLGLLREYLEEPKLRENLFQAISAMPLTKVDFVEPFAQRVIREGSPDEVAKLRQEMAAEGLDPDRPKIVERLAAKVHRENA